MIPKTAIVIIATLLVAIEAKSSREVIGERLKGFHGQFTSKVKDIEDAGKRTESVMKSLSTQLKSLLDDAIKEMQAMEVEINAEKTTSEKLRTENSQLKNDKNVCEGKVKVLEDTLAKLQKEKESEDCCLDDECRNYAGTVNKTTSGRTCQAWNVNEPHSASYRPSKDGGLNTNFCRNPSGWSFVWCYTTDPDQRWEKCDVPKCGGKALKLHKQVVKLQSEKAELQNQNAELQKENANYKGQINGLTEEKHQLEEKLTNCEKEKEELTKKLKKCEADLEEVTKVCYDALKDCKKKVEELGKCCQSGIKPGCDKDIKDLKAKNVQCVVDLQVCRGDWEKVNGRYVKFFNDKKVTWSEAKASCEEHNAKLLMVKDDVTQEWTKKIHTPVWIGATDQGHEGDWKWVDGSSVDKTKKSKHWGAGEPDSGLGLVEEDCLATGFELLWIHHGQWADEVCKSKFTFVCELPKV